MAKITVKGRLAFGDIFKPTDFNGDGNFKHRATILIEKNSPDHKLVSEAIVASMKDVFKDKWEKSLAQAKAANNLCLRDGDLKDYDGYEGHMALSATNKIKIPIRDRDGKTPLEEADGRPYNGCYVRAIVDVYAYGKHGPQANCTLLGIQFFADGDAFTGARPAGDEDFEDLSVDGEEKEGGTSGGEDASKYI